MSNKKMNRLQLKTLLLSLITEVKFGTPLAPNAIQWKLYLKSMLGLKRNTPNEVLIKAIGQIYQDNGIKEEYDHIIRKFNVKL